MTTETRKAAPKSVVIDALVLAFSHSALKDVVGSDALRAVLNGQYVDFLVGTSFQCQPLWTLLSEQPGFEADKAIPPFCLFKAWESKLGLDVALPAELSDLGHLDRSKRAAEVKIPEKKLDLVFDPKLAAEQLRAKQEQAAALENTQMRVESPDLDAPMPPKKKAMFATAIVVSVVTLALSGFFVWELVRPPPSSPVPVKTLGLPVKDAFRHGQQVGATLASSDWLGKPQDVRDAELKAALARIDAEVLFLKDASGGVIVTVQNAKKGGTVIRWTSRRKR